MPNDSLDKPGAPWKPDEPTVATPTAEQLARWKHASFDPLQLLAFREHELSGQVSVVAVTNDGKHYLLGGTKLTLWDLESDEQVHEFIKANTNEDDRLIGFAVSPVGDWCADV